MNKFLNGRAIGLSILASTSLVLTGCGTVSQAFTPSGEQMAQLAGSAWTDLKGQVPVSTDQAYISRIERVAPRIITAAGGNPAEWEVVVFQSDQLNAFALPGGKIGFYTGILDLMENDDQIAAVMGHEVAHVNFNHSGKRYGRSAATQAGIGAVGAVLGTGAGSQLAVQALGMGAQFGAILPFSRQHELEADKYGLRYMNTAGYNMDEAVRFWVRMSQQKDGSAPPEFFSTHPADQTRINGLQEEINILRGGTAS